jgi:hypothetical protein
MARLPSNRYSTRSSGPERRGTARRLRAADCAVAPHPAAWPPQIVVKLFFAQGKRHG